MLLVEVFFIIDTLLDVKDEEQKKKIKDLKKNLYDIKGYFYYIDDLVVRKNKVISFIYSLLALLQNKKKNNIDKPICIYLYKLLEIFKLF